MNSALAFEIYRGLWLIDGSESSFRNLLTEARANTTISAQRLNTFSMMSARGYSVIQPSSPSSGIKSEKKIAVSNVNGVITKAGGNSSRGMEELSTDMLIADSDPDVIGHLVLLDTPGGSKIAMDYMKHTMQSLTKPKVTMVTRQGMAASAGLGLLSEGNWVMAESSDAQIGSHGVMWGVSGVPNGEKDGNGEIHFVVIADSSPDKNKATETAINNKDISLMKDEVNKAHAGFKENTKALRPNVKDEHMTGSMFPASELVGSLIDQIGSKSDAVNKILELSKTSNTFSKNKNLNKQAMTVEEIKSQFPDAHSAIYNAGVAAGTTTGTEAEQERVKSWQVYASVDPEAVNKGIASGKQISQSEMHGFLLKASSQKTLTNLQTDSNTTVVPPEAKGPEGEKTAEQAEKEKEVNTIFGQFYKKN